MAKNNHVKKAVEMVNSKFTIKWAAILLSSSTLVSSLLGFYRDRLLNRLYYENYSVGLDAYTAAFLVPDFMYFLLVSGAISVSFIPVFNQRLVNNNKKSAWELSTSLINFMALVTLAASILIMVFAEPLVKYLIVPDMSEAGQALAISMMRVIAVNPFLYPPELSTVRFTWVQGDSECPATSEFQDFFVIPLMLEAEQLPATYCIYGLDQAGNTTDVVRIPLESP